MINVCSLLTAGFVWLTRADPAPTMRRLRRSCSSATTLRLCDSHSASTGTSAVFANVRTGGCSEPTSSAADDRAVRERAASVFSAAHVARHCILRERDQDVGAFAERRQTLTAGRIAPARSRVRRPPAMRTRRWPLSESWRARDRSTNRGDIAADRFELSVDHKLRCVDTPGSKYCPDTRIDGWRTPATRTDRASRGDPSSPRARRGQGPRLAEWLAHQSAQHLVGGRTTRAPFGGEQLSHDHGRFRSCRCWFGLGSHRIAGPTRPMVPTEGRPHQNRTPADGDDSPDDVRSDRRTTSGVMASRGIFAGPVKGYASDVGEWTSAGRRRS